METAIYEFDPDDDLHIDTSVAGEMATVGAAKRLGLLHEERDKVTVNVALRVFRKWLQESSEGYAVETAA